MMKNLGSVRHLCKIFYAYPFLFICISIICTHRTLYKYFGAVTANEFLFFMQTPMKGADERLVHVFINRCLINPALYALLICLIPFIFTFLLRFIAQILPICRQICNCLVAGLCSHIKHLTLVVVLLSIIIGGFSIKKLEFFWDVFRIKNLPYSTFYEDHFTQPQAENIKFQPGKNLIVLHVESMEKTFSDRDFYGTSLIPDMEKLEAEGVQFDNYINGYGTSYTASSLIAAFTGIPVNVMSNAFINHLGKKMHLAQKMYSLSKFLHDYNYDTYALMGTDRDFAGQNNFLLEHKIDVIIDEAVIKEKYPQEPTETWGYSDATLLKIAAQTIENRNHSKPYFMYIQTTDTHTGYISKKNKIHKFDNSYHNLIYRTNLAVSEFISRLQKQPDYADTVIVIIGDHLRMGNDFAMPENRTIYNLFLNAPQIPNKHRTFSQIDLYPTIIEAMGATINNHRLGLGVSIFSNEPTLAEQYTQAVLDKELSKRSKLSEELWK